jgi:hypothetical protein
MPTSLQLCKLILGIQVRRFLQIGWQKDLIEDPVYVGDSIVYKY